MLTEPRSICGERGHDFKVVEHIRIGYYLSDLLIQAPSLE